MSRRGVLPLNDGNGEGQIVMSLILKSMEDPDRLQWHEVKKVDHYYLSIDAVTQPMQVREDSVPYGNKEK